MRLFSVLVFAFSFGLVVGCVPPPSDGPRDQVNHDGYGENSQGEVRGEDGVQGDNAKGSAAVNAGQMVDLRYKFKTGEVWKYTSAETTSISISMGDMPGGAVGKMPGGMAGNMPGAAVGAGMKMKYKAVTDFYLKFTQVHADGSADFVVGVDKFKVKALPSGTLMATDQGLDLSQLTASGNIDSKGKVVFYEEIYVLMNERNERYLVKSRLQAKPGEASATTETDDTKVKVYAKFDPKTGQVTGGAIVEEKKKAGKKLGRVEVSGKDKRMDILPKRFMRMFRLPEGKMAVGSSTTIAMASVENTMSFPEYNNNVASLKNVLAVRENGNTQAVGANTPGMEKAGMPKMTGKVKVKFDQKAGKLKSMQGDIKASMNAGMKMEITSHLKLQMR
jgi:hypothetical protein